MNRRHAPRGFTLVEMVVVLAILAALATVAVTSLEGAQDQTRYDTTKQTMENVQDAIVGQAAQQSAPSFVGDLGRFPQAVPVLQPDGSTILQPQELWIQPVGVSSFALLPAVKANLVGTNDEDVDADVTIATGWRGPYIRLGVGQNDLRDGWGNSFDLLQPSRIVCTGLNGDSANRIGIIRSNGANSAADNAAATNAYAQDLYLNFNTNAFGGTSVPNDYPAVAASNIYQGAAGVPIVQGRVLFYDSSAGAPINPVTTTGSSIYVRYFGPNPSGSGVLSITVPDSGNTGTNTPPQTAYSKTVNGVTLTVTIDTTTSAPSTIATYSISGAGATVGPRVIRAYQGALPVPGVPLATPPTSKSSPASLLITPGGIVKDLILK